MTTSATLLKDLEEFCRSHAVVLSGKKLLVAVSGGVDSMVLLHLLFDLKSEWNLGLAVVHVNHQLRGEESFGDEEFVRQTALQFNIPFHCRRVDTMGLTHSMRVSKQVAARDARYRYFEETRLDTRSDFVATAHQADDNAETVLLNALRGTGVRGLAGIPVARDSGRIIRPLLFARRRSVLVYARENGIAFREDSSNRSTTYSRNYLRHVVIPRLDVISRSEITDSLNRLSDSMRRFGILLDRLVDEHLPSVAKFTGNSCSLSLTGFSNEPEFLREEMILRVFRQLDLEPNNLKVQKVLDLCSCQVGNALDLGRNIIAQKERDALIFAEKGASLQLSKNVMIGGTYRFDHFIFSVGQPEPVPSVYANDGFTEYIDGDRIEQPLTFRIWKHGDWFIPLGMQGRKKLSDFFNDVKASHSDKASAPVLESNGNIVWVCGKRLDNRFRITGSTRNAIKLTYSATTNSPN